MHRTDPLGLGRAANDGEFGGPITHAEAQAWVDAYGRAWIARDTEAGAALFASGATFRESHFGPAVIGGVAIREYWRRRVLPQRDNQFTGTVLVMRDNVAMVHWTASFFWRPLQQQLDLDAMARIAFERHASGAVLATMLEDWIERQIREPAWQI